MLPVHLLSPGRTGPFRTGVVHVHRPHHRNTAAEAEYRPSALQGWRDRRGPAGAPHAEQSSRRLLPHRAPGQSHRRKAERGEDEGHRGVGHRRSHRDDEHRSEIELALDQGGRNDRERNQQIGAGDHQQQREQPAVLVEGRDRPGRRDDREADGQREQERDGEAGPDPIRSHLALAGDVAGESEILQDREHHRRRESEREQTDFLRPQEVAGDQHAGCEIDRERDILSAHRPDRGAPDSRHRSCLSSSRARSPCAARAPARRSSSAAPRCATGRCARRPRGCARG